MNGTSHVPSLEACRPGLKIITEVGVERIREKSKRQTARLIELVEKQGWRVNSPRDPEKRGGTVSIDMPDSQEVCRELLKREIMVDWRPKSRSAHVPALLQHRSGIGDGDHRSRRNPERTRRSRAISKDSCGTGAPSPVQVEQGSEGLWWKSRFEVLLLTTSNPKSPPPDPAPSCGVSSSQPNGIRPSRRYPAQHEANSASTK